MNNSYVPGSGPMTAEILRDIERFISFIRVSDTGCWEWTGSFNHKGYAKFWYDDKTGLAMHFVYETFRGPIAEGLEPDHLCKNVGCANPDHLEPVTRRENLLRGNSPVGVNARKLHCIHGHIFDENNTKLVQRNGQIHRHCRTCDRDRHWRKAHEQLCAG